MAEHPTFDIVSLARLVSESMGGSEHLRLVIQRLRLQAAAARAEQSSSLSTEQNVRLRTQLAAVTAEESELRRGAEGSLPIDQLAQRLGLRPSDEAALLTAVALEVDPLFSNLVAGVAGEEPRQGVTAKLLAQLRILDDDALTELGLGPGHSLVRAALLDGTNTTFVETLRPWRASRRTAEFLAGRDEIDLVVQRLGGPISLPREFLTEHVTEQLSLLERLLATDEPVIVLVEGPEGSGRRTLVAQAAQTQGRQAVQIEAGRLAADSVSLRNELRALTRECWLRGALPVVARLDALARRGGAAEGRWPELVEVLESPGAVHGPIVVTALPGSELPEFHRRVVRLRIGVPAPDARQKLWAQALDVQATPNWHDGLAGLAQRYTMAPGAILRSSANARLLARGRELSVADVHAGVAAEIKERFSGLATPVSTSQRWEDLVLPADTIDEIKAFLSRASHAAQVYERWGFREKLGRGFGLTALFSGPPGTGKTMVASLIARQLQLDLYMVDLSQVVSKWVGETEKQLSKIFDAAAMGQALLLFDEADALFSKRTEVKSSNDRYANLEVNYLLSRLEEFAGVAILTTNLDGSIDPAFKRRLAAEVRFYPPDLAERERLWRTLVPPQAPRAADLKFDQLADVYREMCGGHIRNAVLRAAFLAAAEDQPITQDHLQRAGRTEYRAMGKVL